MKKIIFLIFLTHFNSFINGCSGHFFNFNTRPKDAKIEPNIEDVRKAFAAFVYQLNRKNAFLAERLTLLLNDDKKV